MNRNKPLLFTNTFLNYVLNQQKRFYSLQKVQTVSKTAMVSASSAMHREVEKVKANLNTTTE